MLASASACVGGTGASGTHALVLLLLSLIFSFVSFVIISLRAVARICRRTRAAAGFLFCSCDSLGGVLARAIWRARAADASGAHSFASSIVVLVVCVVSFVFVSIIVIMSLCMVQRR